MTAAPPWVPDLDPFRHARAAPDTPEAKAEAYVEFVHAETARRALLADAMENDLELRQQMQDEVYAVDPVAWCNDWVWVENPGAESLGLPLLVPLYLYDRKCMPPDKLDDPLWVCQEDVWQSWAELESEARGKPEGVEQLCKKSREMAISYSALGFGTWATTRRRVRCMYVSTKRELVDVLGDADSLLEKGRIILENLPAWMTGGWDRHNDEHSKLGLLTVPATGGQLKGAWGADAGRAGRALFAFLDEDASNPHSASICKSISKTARVRIRITTSKGPATDFAQKWSKGGDRRLFLHWSGSPFLDSKYGDRYEADNGIIARAQELDGNDALSVVGAVIPPEWMEAAMRWKPTSEGFFTHAIGYDLADEGDDAAVRALRIGPSIVQIDADSQEKPRDGYQRLQVMRKAHDVPRVVYDGGGGFSGTFQSCYADDREKAEDRGEDGLGFVIVGCKGATRAPKHVVFDDDPRPASERFVNMRAVYWWNLRERCRKTWELVNGHREWPEDECVSLPDLTTLREDLLMPRVIQRASKIAITPKKNLPRSTDHADAVCLAFLDFLDDDSRPVMTHSAPKASAVEAYLARRRALLAKK